MLHLPEGLGGVPSGLNGGGLGRLVSLSALAVRRICGLAPSGHMGLELSISVSSYSLFSPIPLSVIFQFSEVYTTLQAGSQILFLERD